MDSQLKKGLLEVCVLSSLRDEPSYGYKIINSLSSLVSLSESTLYTILKRLEANESIVSHTKEENGRVRKYYAITPRGEQKIQDFISCTEEFNRIVAFIDNRNKKEDDEC